MIPPAPHSDGLGRRVSRERLVELAKFLAAGLPAFLLAVPLNYALVETAGLPKPIAYALVQVVQVSVNFFLCRAFVFESSAESSLLKEFVQFVGGILVFRLADWMVYVVAVNHLGFYYLAVQLTNVVVFSVAKFLLAERVFQGGG